MDIHRRSVLSLPVVCEMVEEGHLSTTGVRPMSTGRHGVIRHLKETGHPNGLHKRFDCPRSKNMTPAINIAKKEKIPFSIHEYTHDPRSISYGEEASEKLGVDKDRVFKTLVIADEKGQLSVGILPVSSQLNLKLFAKTIGAKKATMADKKIVEKTTGYVLGGVSPIGQKKKLPTIIHETAKKFTTIFVSAGKRGLEIELAPDDLIKLTKGHYGSVCEKLQ